ncbi:FtsX-like permease family protein [Cryptosporangium sp. NPDC051539]|uniref:ABC transporter permease n=1 Tax=Cryptosporangium sp. NPDC051539 TaxID=3363962 RepID=UPI00378C9ED0
MSTLTPSRPAAATPGRPQGLGKVVRSGVGRHWVQTAVILLATAAAVTAGVLGVGLLVAASGPFDRGFAAQHGAHLTVYTDPAKATAAQLAATAGTGGVTRTAGPFGVATVGLKPPEGVPGPAAQITVVGRHGPASGVDSLSLLDGRWPAANDEIVLAAGAPVGAPVGATFSLDGGGRVTVVGVARSVSETADAWMLPAALPALPATGRSLQMLYRVDGHDTGTQMDTARDAVTAALPSGAVTGTRSWLTTRFDANRRTALFVPFLLGFGALALALAALVVGTVVAGAVGSAYFRIGILKSLGFTPGQVVRGWMAQALIPATIGAGIGIVGGNLAAIPLLQKTERIVADASTHIEPWVDVAVVTGVLGLVAVIAALASLRAGRLRTVDALTLGRTPPAGRGRWAGRALGRVPLSRPLSLGLARPFRAPGRALTMVAAIAFGTAAVTLTVGIGASFTLIQIAAEHSRVDVEIHGGPGSGQGRHTITPKGPDPAGSAPAGSDPAVVAAAIEAQAGTSRWFGSSHTEASSPSLSRPVSVTAFTSDPSWAGYYLVGGRWFGRPGEAVAATGLLTATDTSVGDTLTLRGESGPFTVTIVGETFDPNDDGLNLLTRAAAGATMTDWSIDVARGTDADHYADELGDAVTRYGLFADDTPKEGPADLVVIVAALSGLLSVLMVSVAGLGVLNTVVLDVRERVHDLGVQKALGMTPRQALAGVLAAVVPVGLAGGLLGVGAGLVLHRLLVPAMARAAGATLPGALLDVFSPLVLVALGLGGVVLAIAGALLPATWAARTRTATALRTE